MMSSVKSLCDEITSQKNNLNRLNDLLKLALSNNETECEEAIKGLRKVFKLLIKGKKIAQFSGLNDLETRPGNPEYSVFNEFIAKKFSAFSQLLKANIFKTTISQEIKELSLRVYLELCRYHVESIVEVNAQQIHQELLFSDLMKEILNNLEEFESILFVLIEYISNFPDFSNAFLKFLTNLVKVTSDAQTLSNVLEFLHYIPSVENLEFSALFFQIENTKKKVDLIKRKAPYEIDRDGNTTEIPDINVDLHKTIWRESFSQLIFALANKLKPSTSKTQNHPSSSQLLSFIQGLGKYVFHKMENPILLANFLIEVFDNSTSDFDLQIVSLSQVFVLIGKHQLEYPNFYKKLFSLIDQNDHAKQQTKSIFLTPHTPKFLKLLETSLKTSKLSQKVLSAFLKKILRAALTHPPNIILWGISLTINVIKKNPSLVQLLDTQNLQQKIQDCFQADEKDLDNCNAADSFLWELKTLRHHYLNEVEKMVTVLGTKLDVSHFIELDNFSDVQYEHFIRLYIDAAKSKNVRFTIRQPIEKNNSNMCLFQTEIFE